jgi:hypothetical protein
MFVLSHLLMTIRKRINASQQPQAQKAKGELIVYCKWSVKDTK